MVAACLYDKDGLVFATYPADAARDLFPTAPEKQGYRFGKGEVVAFQSVASIRSASFSSGTASTMPRGFIIFGAAAWFAGLFAANVRLICGLGYL